MSVKTENRFVSARNAYRTGPLPRQIGCAFEMCHNKVWTRCVLGNCNPNVFFYIGFFILISQPLKFCIMNRSERNFRGANRHLVSKWRTFKVLLPCKSHFGVHIKLLHDIRTVYFYIRHLNVQMSTNPEERPFPFHVCDYKKNVQLK